MKWEDLTEKQQAETKGTYAAVNFSKETTDAIKEYIKENDIPNPLSADKMHTTLLYSRKYCPDYTPLGKIDPPWKGTPTEFEVWKTRPKDGSEGSNCLVLLFKCEELNKRHQQLMNELDATYDFPDYKTHISLSYDIGDMDWKKLPDIKKYLSEVVVVEEYGSDLDLDWAKKNG
jgi:hypothetical protein